ncbi:apolipoprotein N-acyltransferase [Sphingomonas sp.]|uniref:apolipoprotein N-acyltransferase n=1 Tax=Sphingomonas sp. TaxID=28214 RepID=UPI002DE21351|nr:apolipoprotein N-acyltransferase [Sphingomonas sp.]HEV2569816.1 apolipoprotein N-acyltransferase [Sphingomonas sp.]
MFRYPKLLALAAGALSATGFAPLGLWPITLACFALLIELLWRARDWRSVFVRGWLFGVAHFTVGLNWIAHAFTYQEAMPHWFGYGAVVALSLYLAVFPPMGATAVSLFFRHPRESGDPAKKGLGSRFRGKDEIGFVLLFSAAFIVTEWVRAVVFTGFAWNPLGVIFVGTPLAAASKAIGTYGLSGLTMLAAGAIWLLARRRWLAGGAIAGALAVRTIWTLIGPAPALLPGTSPLLRVVQPNVSQDEKHDISAQVANLKQLVAMSGKPDDARPRLLLWPEAAIDNGFYLEEEPGLRRFLVKALGRQDMLLTGGVAIEYDRSGRAVGGRNSVFALGPDTRIHARYDKAHLVPYGEYLPMRAILTPLGLSRLVPGDLDFWPGPGPKTFDIPGVGPVGFQICYEIIFSGQVIDPAKRPRFLFNPSNDAWFGAWGPPQHMAQARLRAVEEGMTIVRATPTGISGVIAPDGRLVASIGMGREEVLDARLPQSQAPTLFARYGNLLPAIFALLLAALGVVIRRRAR